MTAPDPPAEANVRASSYPWPRPSEHRDQPCNDPNGPRGNRCVYPLHHECHYDGAGTVWVEAHADAAQIRMLVLAEVDAALRDEKAWLTWFKARTTRPHGATWSAVAADYLRDAAEDR